MLYIKPFVSDNRKLKMALETLILVCRSSDRYKAIDLQSTVHCLKTFYASFDKIIRTLHTDIKYYAGLFMF